MCDELWLNDDYTRSCSSLMGFDGEKYGRVLAQVMERYDNCRAGYLKRATDYKNPGTSGPKHEGYRAVTVHEVTVPVVGMDCEDF